MRNEYAATPQKDEAFRVVFSNAKKGRDLDLNTKADNQKTMISAFQTPSAVGTHLRNNTTVTGPTRSLLGERDKSLPQNNIKSQERLVEWHKDSHSLTKNEDGTPKVFYHGTTSSLKILLNGFKPKSGWTFLTDSKVVADSYQSWKKGDSPDTLSVYVNLKNPAFYDAKGQKYSSIGNRVFDATYNAQKAGHDGIVILDIKDHYDSDVLIKPHTTVVVFNRPTQIKSIHNKGTFDETNPNILFQKDMEDRYLSKDRVNENALLQDAVELPPKIASFREFRKQFDAIDAKGNVVVESKNGVTVEFSVRGVFKHFEPNNNTHYDDRAMFSGAFADTLKDPLAIVKEPHKDRDFVFYKPFKDDSGLYHLAAIKFTDGKFTYFKLEGFKKAEDIIKAPEQNTIYFKYSKTRGTDEPHTGQVNSLPQDFARRDYTQNNINSQPPKGMIEFIDDGGGEKAVISFFESADVSTALHEVAHYMRRDLTSDELIAAEKAFSVKDSGWTIEHEEAFAEGFVKWVNTGEAPTPELKSIFTKMKDWLLSIWDVLRGKEADFRLSDDMAKLYSKMLGDNEEYKQYIRNSKADIMRRIAEYGVEKTQTSVRYVLERAKNGADFEHKQIFIDKEFNEWLDKNLWSKKEATKESYIKQGEDVAKSVELKPNQSRLTEWHKDSAPETKNEDGTPKVFYHGTGADFSEFKDIKGRGLYWFGSDNTASGFARVKPNGNVMPVYLNIKYPAYHTDGNIRDTISKAKQNGNDGIIINKGSSAIVFNPPQIKSIHNKGTFDETNPNILFQKDVAKSVELKPNQSRLTEWHKDSAPETKNEDGTPKVFYHGTGADFSELKTNDGLLGSGVYLTDDPIYASMYAEDYKTPNIMPVYLNIKNPLHLMRDKNGMFQYKNGRKYKIKSYDVIRDYQSKGYDGVIFNLKDYNYTNIVVPDNTQIKSIHNKGTFSENDPNILNSLNHILGGALFGGTLNAVENDGAIDENFVISVLGGALFGAITKGKASKQAIEYAKKNLSTAKTKIIKEFVNKSLNNTQNSSFPLTVGKLTDDEVKNILDTTNIDLSGYIHKFDNYNIKHMFKKHGNMQKEMLRGQIAITEDDVAQIPEIVSNFDKIAIAPKTDIGRDTIIFLKTIGDKKYVVEEIRTKDKSLVPVTLYKFKASTPDAPLFDWKSVPRLSVQNVSKAYKNYTTK